MTSFYKLLEATQSLAGLKFADARTDPNLADITDIPSEEMNIPEPDNLAALLVTIISLIAFKLSTRAQKNEL